MNEANKHTLRGNFLLLAAAVIWGCAFAAQSAAADSVGPWLFNGTRFLLGGIEVLLLSPLLHKLQGQQAPEVSRQLLSAGILCGMILIFASILQQAGIRYTTAGKAGFITSLYVVLVPLFGFLFLRRRTNFYVCCAAVIAVAALYLLSGVESGSVGIGDLLELGCAAAFAVHILVIDKCVGSVDPVLFSAVQFLTAGVIGMTGAVLFEPIQLSALKQAAVPILYAGLMSAGFGYTLQVLGQREAEPAAASVILSLESVFSAVFGFLLLGEVMSIRELLGCALMFCAVLLSQKK